MTLDPGEHLLDEGLVDNETDARLAAVHVLAAANRAESPGPPADRLEPGR